MADTTLGGVIEFFKTLGVYDVVLPFILVFTIMFAILEKTKIFGTEGEKKYSKKNLNAMVSFVIAFLVIASSKLVATITKVSSEIIVVLLLIVFFLMMVGTFFSTTEIEEKGVHLKEGIWRTGFMIVVAIILIFIFLDAIVAEDGRSWLQIFWDWISQFYTNAAVAAIVLIIAIILFMVWITKGQKQGGTS